MRNLATALNAMLVVLVVHLSPGVTRGSAAELPANLVTNPSLEDKITAGALPPGWGNFYSSPADAYRASITDGGRTGKKELRIDCVEEKGVAQFGVMPANRVPLDSTKRYVARGWVKVTGGKRATADVKLHYYDAGGAYLGQTRIGFASPGSDDWQRVTVTDRAAEFPQARRIGLAIACTGDAKAQYDDLELLAFDKDKLPGDFDDTYGVTRSPELAILSRRVGTWETKTKIKPCAWVPQGIESAGIETIHWSVGGQILEGRQKGPEENLSLMTYDARDQVYRSWFFGSNGNLPRSQSVGHWDRATETLTFTNEMKDEFESVVRMKLIGNDTVTWQGIWKDNAGKVLLDVEGTSTRRRAALPDKSPAESAGATRTLDGVWLAESVTADGKAAPAQAVKQTWFKFNETAITFKVDGPEAKGRFTVDAGRSPHHIDVTTEAGPGVLSEDIRGIYELTGDKLKICLQGKTESRDSRPTEFACEPKSGRLLLVLKKQQP